jgi:DNA-binding response OmpR family regulator
MSVEEQRDGRPVPPGMVLVLDDDDLMRGAMRRILEARGHAVATAETAADAIEFCEASNAAGVAGWISLVIADVGSAGADFSTRVAAARPGLAVVYVSGISRPVAERRGLITSGDMFVAKPFSAAALAEAVRAALNR